jgi:hypothetical protein
VCISRLLCLQVVRNVVRVQVTVVNVKCQMSGILCLQLYYVL